MGEVIQFGTGHSLDFPLGKHSLVVLSLESELDKCYNSTKLRNGLGKMRNKISDGRYVNIPSSFPCFDLYENGMVCYFLSRDEDAQEIRRKDGDVIEKVFEPFDTVLLIYREYEEDLVNASIRRDFIKKYGEWQNFWD